MVRNNGNVIHFYGDLLHQYAVDMYVKIEQGRLSYIERNQKKLRADLYKGMIDSVRIVDTNMSEIGKRFILPSSLIGGSRHMAQLYQDALSIVRKLGKPDLFVTFTCNPKWPEITEALGAGQYATARPDLVSRVFKLKLKSLMSLFLLNFLMKMSSLWPMPQFNVVWCMACVGIKMVVFVVFKDPRDSVYKKI